MELLTVPTVTFDSLAQPGDSQDVTLYLNGVAQPSPGGGAATVQAASDPNEPVSGVLNIVQQVDLVVPEFTVQQVPGFTITVGEPFRPAGNYPDRWRVVVTVTKL